MQHGTITSMALGQRRISLSENIVAQTIDKVFSTAAVLFSSEVK